MPVRAKKAGMPTARPMRSSQASSSAQAVSISSDAGAYWMHTPIAAGIMTK